MSWEFKSPHPHSFSMILLKITNASEVVASKVGKFLESLTPDGLDETTVEDIVVSKLLENLQAEGLKGEVLAVKGLDTEGGELLIHEQMRVRKRHTF
jgi:hypothetical protein